MQIQKKQKKKRMKHNKIDLRFMLPWAGTLLNKRKFYIFKNAYITGLEKWLSGEEPILLFQKTQTILPAPTQGHSHLKLQLWRIQHLWSLWAPMLTHAHTHLHKYVIK